MSRSNTEITTELGQIAFESKLGPRFSEAREALMTAYKACFDHLDRDTLGMSHGPFSGVNKALGIVCELEMENARQAIKIATVVSILEEISKAKTNMVKENDPGF